MEEDKNICLRCLKKTEIEREKGMNGMIKCTCSLCKKSWFEKENEN
ncbi:MAG: hypothetical protein PHS54_07205 [Clostridia bacterium]|jgi:hypothetical protein|nr:hypothetical protein [Clostridia bacterium]